jgi:hypothetical protein
VARKACLSGDLTKGVEILTDLYLDSKDATYIFNQGRCFEQNHRYDDAIARFREYLLKASNLGEPEKLDTQKHIDSCQAFLGKREDRLQPENASAPLPAPAAPGPSTPPEPAAEPVAQVTAIPATTPPPADSGSGLRTAGAITTFVGVGALVGGLVFNLKANNLAKDIGTNRTDSKVSSHDNYVKLAWVGYGTGAACIAGGVVLYLLGWPNSSPSGKVALIPSVGPGMAGLVLAGTL